MSSGTSISIEEERLFASFGRRLIEIAVTGCRRGSGAFVVWHGAVVEVNAKARALFDRDINVKNNRFCIRDREASARLTARLDEMTKAVQLKSRIAEPILIQRRDKFPIVLRTLPFKEPMQSSEREVHALVMLPACRPDPSHPQWPSPRIFVV
jgi:hypothetical protein